VVPNLFLDHGTTGKVVVVVVSSMRRKLDITGPTRGDITGNEVSYDKRFSRKGFLKDFPFLPDFLVL